MGENDILHDIIGSIEQLPPISEVAVKILDLAHDPDVGAEDIAELTRYDQSITANCLKLCNSSYFGLRDKVRSIQHAVVLLGIDNLIRIVISQCLGARVFSKELKGYQMSTDELWRHSVCSAIISQLLALKTDFQKKHELYTAALLHDVGKMIIDHFIADNFEAMYALMREENFGQLAAEKAYFGIDHAEVGGMITESWKFPPSLSNAIRNHHSIEFKTAEIDLQSLTALSNVLFYVVPENLPAGLPDGVTWQIDEGILSCFGLTRNDIETIMEQFRSEMKRAQAFLNMSL